MDTNQNVTTSRSRKFFISAIVALVLLLGVAVYFDFAQKSCNDNLTAQQTELRGNFKKLSDTLDMKNSEIVQYKGKNAELDKTIAANQDIMANQKKEITSLLSKNNLTKGELAKAKSMIAQYQANIGDLQKQVGELAEQNQQLNQQNQTLTASLTTEKQTTTQLTDQNKGLAKQVEIGSLLQVQKVDVNGVRKRIGGKEVTAKKAKAAEGIKIAFETGPNKLLTPGPLSLYVRVVNPKGETLAVADQGSGVIESQEGQGQIQYSKKADIEYDQKNKKVVLYWTSNINDPGTYKVELYQAGHMIGTGDVTLN